MHHKMESFVNSLIAEGVKLTPGQPADVKALMNHPDPQPEHFKALRAKLTKAAKPAPGVSAKAGAPVPVSPKQSKGGRKARSVQK